MSPRLVAAVLAASALASCAKSRDVARGDSALHIIAAGASLDMTRPSGLRPRFSGIGRVARDGDIRPWNIDVNASGAGLPAGRGTYERGARVFAERCAMCHGTRGEGIAPNPQLIGREPMDFSFGRDARIVKTIGNYWPYATTLYDYINRAMPFTAPGSLPPEDVYSVVAYLLTENGVIDRRTVIDAHSLPRVHMPARDHFVVDDRTGGSVFR